MSHDIYKSGDRDAPLEVTEHGLTVCRRCGEYESGLDSPCRPSIPLRPEEADRDGGTKNRACVGVAGHMPCESTG